jgi:hypothetical protein
MVGDHKVDGPISETLPQFLAVASAANWWGAFV